MSEKYRSRAFLLLLYPEDPSHAEAYKRLAESGYQYAAILHDKDTWSAEDDDFDPEKHKDGELKKPHWHVVVKFLNHRWDTALAKELGIARNYIWECKNLDDRLLYLVHFLHPDKYQYDSSEVQGPLRPSLEKLLADESEDARVLKIVDLVDAEPGEISARGLLRKLANNGLYGEARRMGYLLKWLVEEHNSEFQRQFDDKSWREYCSKKFDNFCAFVSDKDLDKMPPME